MFSSKIFLVKKHIQVALQYLFNVVTVFNTVFNLKLNFKLKIDLKTCTIKNLEKTENLEEVSQKPVATLLLLNLYTYCVSNELFIQLTE